MASADAMKAALETQMMAQREAHQKQISELRSEIHDKQEKIDELHE